MLWRCPRKLFRYSGTKYKNSMGGFWKSVLPFLSGNNHRWTCIHIFANTMFQECVHDRSTDQPTDRPTDAPTDPPTFRSTSRETDRPAYRSISRPNDRPTHPPTDRTTANALRVQGETLTFFFVVVENIGSRPTDRQTDLSSVWAQVEAQAELTLTY